MKYLLTFLLSILMSNKLSAQEVTYWVGTSANPDPITRHHEAFMDAFTQYRQNLSTSVETTTTLKEGEHPETISNVFGSCKIETVSSVTCEGRETLVLAVGSGALIKYNGQFVKTKNVAETSLLITYEDIFGKEKAKSEHFYHKICNIKTNASKQTKDETISFSYECKYADTNE